MLDFLRQRAGSWLVKVMLGAIIVVFVFWGVGSYRARQANLLAKVNGQPVTMVEFQRLYQQRLDQLQRMFRGQLNDKLLKQLNLPQQVFEDLVRRRLIAQAAHKMGIAVTPDEIRLAIAQIHVFQEKGRFSPERYRLVLRELRMLPQDFEAEVRDQLLEAKVRHMLTSPLVATTPEAKERYQFENEALKVGYVKLAVEDLASQVKPSEAELQKYFQSHQEAYRTPLRLKLLYYLLPFDQVKKEIKISEAEVKEYYESHKQEFFHPEARQIRHILVAVKSGEDEAKALARAKKILAKIKSPKDFARVAKKYSDDPHSKADGGELGYVTKKELFPSLQGPVFQAKPGAIIGPIRSPLGYHIILVEKVRPQGYDPLAKVKDRIIDELKDQKVKSLAWDKANKDYDQIILLGGLKKWATKEHVKLSETPLFAVDNPPNLPILTLEVLKDAQKLEEGELGPPVEVPSGVLIFKLAKRDDPHIPPFAEVKAQVKADYVAERARELCREKAEKLLTLLRQGAVKKVLQKQGLTLQETGYFKRKEALEKSGLPPAVAQEATALGRKGQWLEHPVPTSEAFYLLELLDYKPADLKDFAKQKEALKARLTQEKRNQAFASWYEHLRETAEVKLYQKIPNP